MKKIYKEPEIDVVNFVESIATATTDGAGGEYGAGSVVHGGGFEPMPSKDTVTGIEPIG